MAGSIPHVIRDDDNILLTKGDGQFAPLQDAISVRAATLEQALSPIVSRRMSDPSIRVSGAILALPWHGVRA